MQLCALILWGRRRCSILGKTTRYCLPEPKRHILRKGREEQERHHAANCTTKMQHLMNALQHAGEHKYGYDFETTQKFLQRRNTIANITIPSRRTYLKPPSPTSKPFATLREVLLRLPEVAELPEELRSCHMHDGHLSARLNAFDHGACPAAVKAISSASPVCVLASTMSQPAHMRAFVMAICMSELSSAASISSGAAIEAQSDVA
jgi:hypothetical protein